MIHLLAQAAQQAADDAGAASNDAATASQTTDAAAQTAQQVAADPSLFSAITDWLRELFGSGAMGLMLDGGFFMWPILILGVLALGVMIERWRSLKMLGTDNEKLRRDVLGMLQEDRIEDAMQRCDDERGPVPAILSAGLRKFLVLRRLRYDPGRIEAAVLKSMEDYGVHVVAALERHLPVLATVAAVAPMIGFLGTVQGMIIAFGDIEAMRASGGGDIIEAAAGGIKTALLTTCFGLIVGIPVYLAFNYFTSVINRFVLDVEESAAELIEAVTLRMTLEQRGDNGGGSGSRVQGLAEQPEPV
jgi:biopolymer transport protein ExbB